MPHYDLDHLPQFKPLPSLEEAAASHAERRHAIITYILTFLIMLVTWIILSCRFDAFHLLLGVGSSALVAYLSRELLFTFGRTSGMLQIAGRFMAYVPWLIWQIVLASLHVMYLAFSPRMMVRLDPHILTLETKLKSDISQTTLANSITLTPGTITIHASKTGAMTVHAIDRKMGHKASLHDMAERVGRIYGEN